MQPELIEKVAQYLECRLGRELMDRVMNPLVIKSPEWEAEDAKEVEKIQTILNLRAAPEAVELFIAAAVLYLSQFEEM